MLIPHSCSFSSTLRIINTFRISRVILNIFSTSRISRVAHDSQHDKLLAMFSLNGKILLACLPNATTDTPANHYVRHFGGLF